ncbi:MAG: phage tail sheath family protein [Deltaproteobacteria bacterium]|nr:phage tail sheath family protein [Deltaproteobacteria bacterium]MCB9785924.1 phage tail sheath family protein [Deltaproteobacteria bacterium]
MATSYLSPGVYVEEVDRGSKPLEMVGTSTAGFIGETSVGPVNQPILCTNWSQFTKAFGDFQHSEYLAHAVYGFFNNGGGKCFVLNVGAAEGDKKAGKAGLYIGTDNGPGTRTGLKAFEDVDEINIVCAPGQTDPVIHDAVLSHCENMRYRFAILDPPEVIEKGGVDKLGKPRDSKYGAYYFPWLEVYDPYKGNVFQPPSGYMAGIYARSDGERGVHKAPANELVRGALGLKYNITKGEQDILNPKGINCIRTFPNRGIRVWGARTISSDASWRYVNVRRLFNMVEQSIELGTQWVVFEPNDAKLWKRITRDIGAFLMRLWRQGALFGSTPEEAFYVKCDAETNPPEVIDAGQLICEIGMCPVKPAEFVIFRIGQMPSGGDVAE